MEPPDDKGTGDTPGGRAARRAADRGPARPDRLAPLLRELLAYGLVEPSASGGFVLTGDAQRWLAQESARRAHPSTPEVSVGRPCQRCHATGVTRVVDGVRLCPACQAQPAVAASTEATGDGRRPRHDHRPWRGRRAG